MGDFNFPEINWISNTVIGSEESEPHKFFDLIQDEFYVQHVEKPTRRRGLQKPSMLDLIFSKDENMVNDIVHSAPLGSSDHDGLSWTYVTHSGLWASYTGGQTHNFVKGDYNKIRNIFSDID